MNTNKVSQNLIVTHIGCVFFMFSAQALNLRIINAIDESLLVSFENPRIPYGFGDPILKPTPDQRNIDAVNAKNTITLIPIGESYEVHNLTDQLIKVWPISKGLRVESALNITDQVSNLRQSNAELLSKPGVLELTMIYKNEDKGFLRSWMYFGQGTSQGTKILSYNAQILSPGSKK